MNRITTQKSTTQSEVTVGKEKMQPRISTIAFLKQFARAYNCQATIQPTSLQGFIVN